MRRLLIGLALLAPLAGAARADVIVEWNQTAIATLEAVNERRTPSSGRALAMMHAAMFDAVNGVAHRYQPYALDVSAASGASAEAAAAVAAHRVLSALVPAQAAALDAALAASLAPVPSGNARGDGQALGEAAAGRVLALRRGDGATVSLPYIRLAGPGLWEPQPPDFAAVWVGWRRVTPFTLRSASQFRAPGPPALDSARYAADFEEVKRLGGVTSPTRTADQVEAGRFWFENSQLTWNAIARLVATARPLPLVESARLFALLNLAGADASIAAIDSKYTFNFWRPNVAVRAGDGDGNDATRGDPTWTPLIATPYSPFPDYPSQHSVYGAAAATVLAGVFGDATPFTLTTSTAPGGKTRAFTSFSHASRENAEGRIWIGYHFPASCRDGVEQGATVGTWVLENVLRPR